MLGECNDSFLIRSCLTNFSPFIDQSKFISKLTRNRSMILGNLQIKIESLINWDDVFSYIVNHLIISPNIYTGDHNSNFKTRKLNNIRKSEKQIFYLNPPHNFVI